MAPWFTIGFLSLLLVAGLWAFSLATPDLVKSLRASSWPTTQGEILSSEVIDYSGSKGRRRYIASVEYSYTIGNTDYTGGMIAFGYQGTKYRNPHKEVVDTLPKNSSVIVRFDPDDPQTAVLSHGIHSSLKNILIFFLVWFGVVVAFMVMDLISYYNDGTLLQNISKPIDAE